MASLQPRVTLSDVWEILTAFVGHFEREWLLVARQAVVTLLFMIKDPCGYTHALDTVLSLLGAEFLWKTLPPKAGSLGVAFKDLKMRYEIERFHSSTPQRKWAENNCPDFSYLD